eukprot:3286406-Pleurochrysis_carterae.AAC.1
MRSSPASRLAVAAGPKPRLGSKTNKCRTNPSCAAAAALCAAVRGAWSWSRRSVGLNRTTLAMSPAQ